MSAVDSTHVSATADRTMLPADRLPRLVVDDDPPMPTILGSELKEAGAAP